MRSERARVRIAMLRGTRLQYLRRQYSFAVLVALLSANAALGTWLLVSKDSKKIPALAFLLLVDLKWGLALIQGPRKQDLKERAKLGHRLSQGGSVYVPSGYPSPSATEKALAFVRRIFKLKDSN
jgi:hypothetical protein